MLLFVGVFIVAMTVQLVEAGFNRLRYLVSSILALPATIDITTLGGPAGSDLLADSTAGPIHQCANAFAVGLGQLAAGAKTQAQARAIWLADGSDAVLGNSKVPRCSVKLQPRETTVQGWTVDANVDASGHPFIVISNNSTLGEAYLDVIYEGGIGR